MIWLTWRQSRAQLLATLALLALIAVYLLLLGNSIRSGYRHDVLGCLPTNGCNIADAKDHFVQNFGSLVAIPAIVLIALPAIIGVFWGTPLITRELETNTHRLVWNQSITRTRWLATKLVFLGLAAVLTAGALSLLLTWAASRYDQTLGNRFDTLSFASRNIAPLGYITFAFILGTTIGLFLRRTVPAMAVTLLIIGVAQILVPSLTRPHLRPPATISVPFDASVRSAGGVLDIGRNRPLAVLNYTIPGALMLQDNASLLSASGKTLHASDVESCLNGAKPVPGADTTGPDQLETCIAAMNVHFDIQAQPASRYWSFQWLEAGIFFAAGLLLAGLAFWRIRRLG
jgi:ABC-type transport system involved in multi-copper enzyme maturation permease subunit